MGSNKVSKFGKKKSFHGDQGQVEFNWCENDAQDCDKDHFSQNEEKSHSDGTSESSCGAFRRLKEDPPKTFDDLIKRARTTSNSLLML